MSRVQIAGAVAIVGGAAVLGYMMYTMVPDTGKGVQSTGVGGDVVQAGVTVAQGAAKGIDGAVQQILQDGGASKSTSSTVAAGLEGALLGSLSGNSSIKGSFQSDGTPGDVYCYKDNGKWRLPCSAFQNIADPSGMSGYSNCSNGCGTVTNSFQLFACMPYQGSKGLKTCQKHIPALKDWSVPDEEGVSGFQFVE